MSSTAVLEHAKTPGPEWDRMIWNRRTFLILALTAIVTMALMCIPLAWAWALISIERSYAPPTTVTSFDKFIEHYGEPPRLEIVRVDGEEFLVARMPMHPAAVIYIPSGPPIYVFDKQRNFIYWEPESGEGGPYEANSHRHVTITEANDWFGR